MVDAERPGVTSWVRVNAGETEVADLKLRNSDDVSLVEVRSSCPTRVYQLIRALFCVAAAAWHHKLSLSLGP
jgi:hypothetical protein